MTWLPSRAADSLAEDLPEADFPAVVPPEDVLTEKVLT